MEPLGPVVPSSQVPSLDLPKQELKVPLNVTEEKEAIGETEKPGRCLTFFCLNLTET